MFRAFCRFVQSMDVLRICRKQYKINKARTRAGLGFDRPEQEPVIVLGLTAKS